MLGKPDTRGACAMSITLGLLLAGCSSTPSGDLGRARSECPMGTMMYCDANRRGNSSEYSNCRCITHTVANDILMDY